MAHPLENFNNPFTIGKVLAHKKKKVRPRMTIEDYQELDECYGGMCLDCGEFKWDGCEPDASGYECDECGAHRVEGAGNCLIMGLVY